MDNRSGGDDGGGGGSQAKPASGIDITHPHKFYGFTASYVRPLKMSELRSNVHCTCPPITLTNSWPFLCH